MVSPLTTNEVDHVDWDSLYEEAVEEEEVDMKNHGSVITHLLSQVRIYLPLLCVDFSNLILYFVIGEDWNGPHKNSSTNIHLGAKVSPRNVRGFLCPSRHLHGDRSQGESGRKNYSGDRTRELFDLNSWRLFQVLKWYLSAFSASRKTTVAKKPYNPILGKEFLKI